MHGASSYRVFVVRLHQDGSEARPVWRGQIELVGSDERRAIEGASGVVAFIEEHLAGREPGPTGATDRQSGGAETHERGR